MPWFAFLISVCVAFPFWMTGSIWGSSPAAEVFAYLLSTAMVMPMAYVLTGGR